MGVQEIAGPGSNQRIETYHSVCDGKENWLDHVPWCSSFLNWCFLIATSGIKGTGSALASSWLEWGEEILKPIPGCIAVVRVGEGYHVALYVGPSRGGVYLLGGNQRDEVNVTSFKKAAIESYRVVKAA